MTPETLALIVQVIEALMIQAPEMAAAGDTIKQLLTSNTDPTAEQEVQIRTALDAANARLQAG